MLLLGVSRLEPHDESLGEVDDIASNESHSAMIRVASDGWSFTSSRSCSFGVQRGLLPFSDASDQAVDIVVEGPPSRARARPA